MNRWKKILVPVDFSENARRAVRRATEIATLNGARLYLLNVIEPLPVARVPSEFSVPRTDLRNAALMELKQVIERDVPDGVAAAGVVRRGLPFEQIVGLAQARRIDLIVMATHGYSGLRRTAIGSTTEKVVRSAPCPVLTVPSHEYTLFGLQRARRPMRLLVPVDFSPLSRAALRRALVLASQRPTELLVLHVVAPVHFPSRVALKAERLQQDLTHSARERLRQWLASETPPGVRVRPLVQPGTPFDTINRMAGRLHVDLVIIASHGRSGWKRLLLGSTAERVLRYAACPVLVLRGPNAF